MNLNDWADIGTIFTAVAVVFAVFQVVTARTQRHREFENLYVQRYWQILDRMPDWMYLNQENSEPTPDERRLAVVYLRLSEDEVDLRRQGFITDRTWAIWSEGILAQLDTTIYADALTEHTEVLPSLTDFVQSGSDPLSWRPVSRWWAGLY